MAKGIEAERESLANDKELPRAERNVKEARLDLSSLILKDDSLPPRHGGAAQFAAGRFIAAGGGRWIFIGEFTPASTARRCPASARPRPAPTGTLTPEQIWSLVDYVRSLPYEAIDDHPRQKPVLSVRPSSAAISSEKSHGDAEIEERIGSKTVSV